jgi:hypothetical protein
MDGLDVPSTVAEPLDLVKLSLSEWVTPTWPQSTEQQADMDILQTSLRQNEG